MAFPTVGQRSFLRAPQLATIAEKTMISVSTFAVFMITKFNYKLNENLVNLWPVLDEVYHLSVNPPQNPPAIDRNKQKLKSKFPGKKLPNFDDQLRTKWGEWYIPAKTFLNGMEKFKAKLPSFYDVRAIGFGTALEQCTSEALALWKAENFPANTVVSLTGGLGIDDWAWAKRGAEVHSFEIQEQLNLWSCINFEKLGVDDKISRYHHSAEEALAAWDFCNEVVDIIYIDPDRRPATQSGNRIITAVDQYSPNIFELYNLHRLKAKTWLVKLSPMVDIHWFQAQLNVPMQAYALCTGKEVKEIFVAIPGAEEIEFEKRHDNAGNNGEFMETTAPALQKHMIHIGEETHDFDAFIPSWLSANWDAKMVKHAAETVIESATVSAVSGESANAGEPVVVTESKGAVKSANAAAYIYEPHAGIFCMGMQREIAAKWQLESLGNDSFFLSPAALPKWLGRTLKIEAILKGSLREIGRKLKENQQDNITITARNCGMATLALVQKLGTKENSQLHGFIFKSGDSFCLYVGKVA